MLSAQDVMTRSVTTIKGDATVDKLIKTIKSKNFSGLPVIDDDENVIGVVSQNDVLRGLAYIVSSGKLGKSFQTGKRKASLALLEAGKGTAVAKFLKMPVNKIMTSAVESCSPHTPVRQVCEQMVAKRIHRVVVLDNGKVAGLISATDLVRRFGQSLAATQVSL